MNERHLFRGKRVDNGEWIYGCYIYHDERHHITTGNHDKYDVVLYGNIKSQGLEVKQVDSATLSQCTGLKDKHGTLIFEGDVVKDEAGRIMRVQYSEHFQQMRLYSLNEISKKHLGELSAKFGVHIFDWIYPKMSLEIIGNIHDNPGLLKGEAHE
jgi:uncharacterized phage protein (TIGR01671 family)